VNVQVEIPTALSLEITDVTLGATSTVSFKVTDGIGRGAIGLRAGSTGNVRFTLAKLVEGASGDADAWHAYINREATSGTNTAKQATYEREGTLVDNGDGTYVYTFATDITTVTDPVTDAVIGYEDDLTHRFGMQIAGGGLPAVNGTHDFVPDGTDVATTRNLAMTASCNECHGELRMHGSRYEVKYCVTCHNDADKDAVTMNGIGMTEMVHKIHMGATLPSVVAGGEYKIGTHDYSHVGMPMGMYNCSKCHSAGDAETPDGDNWNMKPTMAACGSCHDNVNFATGAGHSPSNMAQTNNAMCATCHSAAAIKGYHTSNYATPNNPDLPAGLSNITYEVTSASVNASNQPVVRFRILRDTTPLTLTALPADLTGGPSFLLAYALPQDGISAPTDYNNLGRPAAQPATVSIANLIAGTAGTLTAEANGYYTAVISSASFPAGATMRAVALQGYFTQVLNATNYGRYTPSVIASVTGDAVRRSVVDDNKCLACHEQLALHGGNRVNNTAVCVTCHNPNLSASGKTLDLANAEDSNNLKDLVHGIHASAMRENPYVFVRNFQGAARPFDWSHVTYPGQLGNCLTCHKEGTYELPVDYDALPTTTMTTDGVNATTGDVTTARNNVPNATDRVNTPTTSSCFYCHDSQPAVAHMEQNGGAVNRVRGTVSNAESCAVCHGAGRNADIAAAHTIR
jgi:OmcA/MtrC family decaheme c-type cytochrome